MPTNSFVFWHGMALFTFHLLLLCICSSWRFEWIVRNRAIEPLIHICRLLGWLHLHTYCTCNVVYFVFQPAEDIEMGCSSARYAQMKCVCVMYVCHICTLQIALVVTREESRWYCHIYGFLRAFIFFTIRVEKKIIFRFCSFHADAAKIIIRDSTECVADVGCEDNKSMHKGHKITGFSSIVRRWQCCLFVSVWCEWQNVLNGWANGQMNDVLVVPSDSEVIYLSCVVTKLCAKWSRIVVMSWQLSHVTFISNFETVAFHGCD